MRVCYIGPIPTERVVQLVSDHYDVVPSALQTFTAPLLLSPDSSPLRVGDLVPRPPVDESDYELILTSVQTPDGLCHLANLII